MEQGNFHQRIDQLQKDIQSDKSPKELKTSYLMLREAYKKIEVYLSYYENDLVRKKLNGTPLPYLEENTADGAILEPHGLQVIDELFGASFECSEKKNC